MKKLMVSILTAILLFTIFPVQSNAMAETSPASTKTAEAAEATALLNRLDEINKMDKSTLKVAEKKELRKEVRATKQRLEKIGSGVYLSVGAIIIIILLLILLL